MTRAASWANARRGSGLWCSTPIEKTRSNRPSASGRSSRSAWTIATSGRSAHSSAAFSTAALRSTPTTFAPCRPASRAYRPPPQPPSRTSRPARSRGSTPVLTRNVASSSSGLATSYRFHCLPKLATYGSPANRGTPRVTGKVAEQAGHRRGAGPSGKSSGPRQRGHRTTALEVSIHGAIVSPRRGVIAPIRRPAHAAARFLARDEAVSRFGSRAVSRPISGRNEQTR